MDTRNSRNLLATLGFIGIVALSASFAINPGPPAGATLPQIMVWGKQNQVLIEVVLGSRCSVRFCSSF